MAGQIYTVNAWIVDANGVYNTLSGYPKNFNSINYSDDVEKTYKRAMGDLYEVFGTFCKRDDRLIQTVILYKANGEVLCRKCLDATIVESEEL